MHAPSGDDLDLAAIRERLRKMSDAQLERHGRAAAYMASPAASYGPVRATYLVQLEEARAEWRRRHSGEPVTDPPVTPADAKQLMARPRSPESTRPGGCRALRTQGRKTILRRNCSSDTVPRVRREAQYPLNGYPPATAFAHRSSCAR
jgi:hypothetical protein